MANNVIKISRVGPATSLVDPLILPLTFFDLVWLPDKPTNRVIFYKLTESSTDSFYSVILPKLEQSLSLVLTHFHPLSGHVKWDPQDPKPCIVVFPQDTVSLTVAEITDADFSRVSGKGLRHQTELHPLVSELPVFSSDSASAFTLQITLFPKQGFCVGLTINHLVMDGKTVVKFLKSWAHICKYGTTPQDIHLPMLLDRKVINIPPELESDFFKRTPYLSGNVRTLKFPSTKKTEDLVRVTLELTQENVKKLRERAKSESTLSDDLHLSTFVLTYAYVLTCVVKARGDDEDRPVPFTFAADFRDRLDPPVPVNYFGNCGLPISFSGDKAKTFLGEDGFVNAVKILSDSVKGLDSRGAESIWELYEEGLKNMELGSAQKLSVSGSNKFGIYGCDFGWGRPVSTENVFFNKNLLFSMTEMRDETGGVEIGMCLQKCVMDGFISVFQNGL
uniref:BAHD acyltransferase n=1 Tax=Noccaea caerulescens TaxID=107243 RepID=A0A1J3JDZ2_NOCCA